MKALFERLNGSRQPFPPISQRLSNSPSRRGYVSAPRQSSPFRRQIESALQDYEKQTGFNLVDHPFAKRFQGCQRIFNAMDILREQVAQGIGDNYGRLLQSLRNAVYVLHELSTSTVLREVADLVRQRMQMGISCLCHSLMLHLQPLPPKEAILTCLAILLAVCVPFSTFMCFPL